MSCGKKLPCPDVLTKGEHPDIVYKCVCVCNAQCNYAIEGMCECGKELPCCHAERDSRMSTPLLRTGVFVYVCVWGGGGGGGSEYTALMSPNIGQNSSSSHLQFSCPYFYFLGNSSPILIHFITASINGAMFTPILSVTLTPN